MGSSKTRRFAQDHIPQQQWYLKSCPGMHRNAVSIPDRGTTTMTTARSKMRSLVHHGAQSIYTAKGLARNFSGYIETQAFQCWSMLKYCGNMRKPFLRSVEFLSPRTGTSERNEQAALPTGTLQSLTRSACSRLALLNFCATVRFARFNTTSQQFQGGKGITFQVGDLQPEESKEGPLWSARVLTSSWVRRLQTSSHWSRMAFYQNASDPLWLPQSVLSTKLAMLLSTSWLISIVETCVLLYCRIMCGGGITVPQFSP